MPCARRIYARTFRVISGFGPHGVLAQMRAPRMRRLSAACSSGRHFAYSFLQAPPRGECLTLAVRLTVPITRARRGLPPPSHRLVTTPTNRCLRTSRHTWRTVAALTRGGAEQARPLLQPRGPLAIFSHRGACQVRCDFAGFRRGGACPVLRAEGRPTAHRVGGRLAAPSSHTTVRTVPYTAVHRARLRRQC